MALREPLDKIEARILGVLVEKSLTTPDGYPLSINALVTGCNQKSNRHPVLTLTEQTVNEALLRLRLHRLVKEIRTTGARVIKFAHTGEEQLEVDTPSLAILAELLLRGPQTSGELRGRVSRMSPLPALADLEAKLGPLVERGMVQRLPPLPGARAARVGQTLSPNLHDEGSGTTGAAAAAQAGPPAPREADVAPSPAVSPGASSPAAPPATARGTYAPPAVDTPAAQTSPGQATAAAPSGRATDRAADSAAVSGLAGRVGALEEEVALLRRRLDQLAARLTSDDAE